MYGKNRDLSFVNGEKWQMNKIISTKEKVKMTDKDNNIFYIRRLTCSDREALKLFNEQLGTDRDRFKPHPYDDHTLNKLLVRSENGDDLTLGLFRPHNGEKPDMHINSPSDDRVGAGKGNHLSGYFFLWYFRNRVPLLGIGLLPECQGAGLGEKIVKYLVRQAEAAGCEGVELTTLHDNHQAFAVYEKCGFKYYGDVENKSGDGQLIVERAMFHQLKPGAKPMEGTHGAPV